MGRPRSSFTRALGEREPVLMAPRPGEIYWAYVGNGGRHPVIVVSREELNRGDHFIGVLLTSSRLETRRNLPNCVSFLAGQHGLSRDCVAQAESITFLNRSDIDWEAGPVGTLDDNGRRDVIRAIGHVISADCEPV